MKAVCLSVYLSGDRTSDPEAPHRCLQGGQTGQQTVNQSIMRHKTQRQHSDNGIMNEERKRIGTRNRSKA